MCRVFMYIRACRVSCTSTHSKFLKGGKGTGECYHVPSPAGRKLFLHATTRLPTQRLRLSSTRVPPVTSIRWLVPTNVRSTLPRLSCRANMLCLFIALPHQRCCT